MKPRVNRIQSQIEKKKKITFFPGVLDNLLLCYTRYEHPKTVTRLSQSPLSRLVMGTKPHSRRVLILVDDSPGSHSEKTFNRTPRRVGDPRRPIFFKTPVTTGSLIELHT